MSSLRRPLVSTLLFALAAAALACSDDTSGLGDGGSPPGSCANDDACPLDQHCENMVCVAGSGNACTTDQECGPGRTCQVVTGCGAARCHGNTCQPKSCTMSEDCGGWVCTAGTCTACDATHACPQGFDCDASGVCMMTPPPECMRDADCMSQPGTICLRQMCVAPTMCQTSADCPSDLRCIRNACREPCTSAMDCGPPFMWSCDTQSGECLRRCAGDNTCPMGQICEMQSCAPAECTTDAECTGADQECQGEENGHGRCVDIVRCDAMGNCPQGSICDVPTNTCQPLDRCSLDRDCGREEYCEGGFCYPSTGCAQTPCPAGFDCVGEVCVPAVCRGNADCTAPEVCIAGACSQPPPPSQITQVRILTPAGVVRPGTTYAFTAVALDQTGRVVPGISFTWASTSTRVASINGVGLATGGPQAGTTIITASIFNGTTTISSPGVGLTNLGPLAMGDVRVTVVAQSSGSAIAGALVELAGVQSTSSMTTGMSGVATFTGAASNAPYTITVAHPMFDYVTVLALSATDVLIPLPNLSKPSIAGGVKGTVDLSQVHSSGALSISLNGSSIASPILSFDPALLFGGDLFTITVPQIGDVPLPAGTTLNVEFMGTPIPLKETYYARATTGVRAAWSFGGRLGFEIFQGGGGGGFDPVGAILPYLSTFDHGVRPVIDVLALPTVVDTSDVDGDGNTTETVPDWNNFPSVALTPDAVQSLRYQMVVDNLPVVSGGNANTLLVIAGTLLPGVGFVPLGLDGKQDDLGNGIIAPFTTKIAPAHAGLEVGDYVVLATAVRIAQGGLPGPGSARLLVTSQLPTTVDVSTEGWLDSPTDATWQENLRNLDLPPVNGADYYRASFTSDDGTWHVYLPAPAAPATAVAMPSAPLGMVDRTLSATISVDAVDLAPGTTADQLFDLAAGGSTALDRATRGFSRARAGR